MGISRHNYTQLVDEFLEFVRAGCGKIFGFTRISGKVEEPSRGGNLKLLPRSELIHSISGSDILPIPSAE